MPSFLFMDGKTGAGGATCAAYRYVNATATQIGNTFGVRFGTTDTIRSCPRNNIIQFQGELYAMAQDGVYKKDDPTSMTGGWTQQIAFTSPDTSFTLQAGLFPVEAAGVTYLVGMFNDTLATRRWVKFDGTTWTQAASAFATGNNMARTIDAIVYNGLLFIIGDTGGAAECITYDPATDSVGTVASSIFQISQYAQSMCVFQNRLFCLYRKNVATQSLAEFTAGSWSFVTDIGGAQSNANFILGKSALFTDGTFMYALHGRYDGAGTQAGWNCRQYDSALAETVITTTVLPAELRNPGSGGTYPTGTGITEARMHPVYDADTTPGMLDIYLMFAPDSADGTSYTMYKWNGNAAVMTTVDVGGNVYHSPPSGFPNHGERIWTAGELDIKIVSRLGVLGGERISFVAYGGGTGRKFKLYYSTNSSPVLQEATLIGPVTGGSATLNSGLNQVEGIAADGATVYTVVWDFLTDGLVFTQRVNRAPQISA